MARISFWLTMRSSSPSTVNSVPAYFEYRTRSPSFTSIFSRVPSSRVLPGPTDRMVPSCGFSLAVSGRTIPLLVTSSRGVGWMTTRSPRGLSFLLLTVALANAQFLLRAAGGCLPSLLLDVVCSTPVDRRKRSCLSAVTAKAVARESLAQRVGRTRRSRSAIAAATPDRPISTLPLRVLTAYRRRYGMSSVGTPGRCYGGILRRMSNPPELPEYAARNREYWDARAPEWIDSGERSWASPEPTWGMWGIPESELHMLEWVAGKDAVELGCGTGYISAWLARLGARPVGIDNSAKQLETARRLQTQHGLDFPLIHGVAEAVPYPDASFDFAISEYGAAIWSDPYTWIPEAHRLLRPGGRFV